jgi:hypothetical protein
LFCFKETLKNSIPRYAILLRLDDQGLPSMANPLAALQLAHGIFRDEKQKTRFLLFSIFQSLNAIEKWRHIPIPQDL